MAENYDNTESFSPLISSSKVGHYIILEKIGAGGMGEVYLADDSKLSRKVALKFMPYEMCRDADCKARFIREAQAAARLNHTNIMTIYETGEYQARPYIVMEFCRGESLRDLLKELEPTVDRTLDIALQIGEGLNQAHRAGVIHRDIKPSNILIDDSGKVKIVDFGLADLQGGEQLTKSGSTLGTVGYMSPEQVRGEKTDERSDLFSFGVVLYEMLAGRPPFKENNDAATIKAILEKKPEPLTRYKSDLPDELQRIVLKLLEKESKFRYQSAADLLADLKRLQLPERAALPPQKTTDWWNRFVVTSAAAVLLIMAIYWLYNKYIAVPTHLPDEDRIMLAVLPFENLGDPEDEYFADGITDAINTRLASIHGMGVISRTSTMVYKKTNKRLPEIAKELGVDYILEGTILWDKSKDIQRIRVIPQLINVANDIHLWSDEIDRDLNDLFAVQAEIATSISEALGLTLLEPEKQMIHTAPTQNMDAYHYYLKGMELWKDERKAYEAITMFEKAVEYDSSFYFAYRMLAQLNGFKYINSNGVNDSYYQMAKYSAEKAYRLAGGNPEGQIAMGYFHYYCSRDYEKALDLFDKALKQQPNNSSLLSAIGFVKRRQGHWEEAEALLRKSLKLDPRNVGTMDALTRTLYYMHNLEDARRLNDSGLVLAPKSQILLIWNLFLTASLTENREQIKKSLDELEKNIDRTMFNYWVEAVDIAIRDYESALNRRDKPGGYIVDDSVQYYLSRANIYGYMNKEAISRIYYDSALTISLKEVKSDPENANLRMNLATAYAGLGEKEKAIKEGEYSLNLMPVEKDAMAGSGLLNSMADVYILTEEYDKAIVILEYLLANPSILQPFMIRIFPRYDPLRDHPRFKALLEKYK